ncbi:MAG: OmpA family protein, partial [Deltaproteobacteria bacterium]|nr:OmpA family protein [Deltaproteobacteria bacterium]
CVTSGTHKKKLAAAKKAHDDDISASKKREGDLSTKLTAANTELDTLRTDKAGLQKQVDIMSATGAAMEERLKQLGQNVTSLTSRNQDATRQLEELRRQKVAAEARAAQFRSLVAKLQQMITSKELKVLPRNGRLIIALPNDILFDSGSTTLKPAGQKALEKIAAVLATIDDRNFLVAGHTDNVPIKTGRYSSNWELSTERAVNVVTFLVKKGMKPKVLSAAGYSEFDPIAENNSEPNKALNRRIEIVLQPNISELPSLDDIK